MGRMDPQIALDIEIGDAHMYQRLIKYFLLSISKYGLREKEGLTELECYSD